MRVIDGSGRMLDAKYFVEPVGAQLTLVLESRTGKPPRNPEYKPTLKILLTRLAALKAILRDALVDSSVTRSGGYPDADRRIVDTFPIMLAEISDVVGLGRRMGTLQAKVARPPGAKGSGNSHRRIRLLLDVPGYGLGDAARLEGDLATPALELRTTPQGILEQIAAISGQSPNDNDYATVGELAGDLDRVAKVVQRIEQSYLRRLLFPKGTATCDLCGRKFQIEFLVAAHIKRRSACSEAERRDVRHVVMAACRFGCDELFERGYVTIAEDGKLLLSTALGSCEQATSYARSYLSGRWFGQRMAGRESYFSWHRAYSFRTDRPPT
jgi:hypothetical protein